MIQPCFIKFVHLTALLTIIFLTGFGQHNVVDQNVRALVEKHGIVGLSVAVVKNNEIVYAQSFGYKNFEDKVPLNNKDIFRIASISKSFSATSIMQLVQAGKLNLDDDFSDLVGIKIRNPRYPEKIITLKMVLSHTSSINDSQGYFNLDVINPSVNTDYSKCYNEYEPGTGYQYCNLNYNMVGAVIERSTGERFDNYVDRHILAPLGLYGGYCVDSLDSNLFVTLYEYDTLAKTYTPSPQAYASRSEQIKNYRMGYTTPIFSPTGGMKISATDLAKYMIMHMNKGRYKNVKILPKKLSKRMQKPIAEEEGYGFAISNISNLIPGKMMTGHTGSAYGLYSSMFFQPKEKFGVIVLISGMNPADNAGPRSVVNETVNLLYNSLIHN